MPAEPQYQSFQALLDEFSSYAARAPNRMLRPVGRVRPGKSAVHWWHYAVAAVTRSRQGRSFNWKQLETVCKLRREYIPLYIRWDLLTMPSTRPGLAWACPAAIWMGKSWQQCVPLNLRWGWLAVPSVGPGVVLIHVHGPAAMLVNKL